MESWNLHFSSDDCVVYVFEYIIGIDNRYGTWCLYSFSVMHIDRNVETERRYLNELPEVCINTFSLFINTFSPCIYFSLCINTFSPWRTGSDHLTKKPIDVKPVFPSFTFYEGFSLIKICWSLRFLHDLCWFFHDLFEPFPEWSIAYTNRYLVAIHATWDIDRVHSKSGAFCFLPRPKAIIHNPNECVCVYARGSFDAYIVIPVYFWDYCSTLYMLWN